MYLISILALAVVVACLCKVNGLNITWLLDFPSLLMILAMTIPIMISAGLLKDLNNAFRFVIGKKESGSLRELKRAVEAVTLAIRSFLMSSILMALISLIIFLAKLDSPEKLGPILAVIILPMIYAVGFATLLFPLRSQLKTRIIERLSEEDENGGM